MLAATCPDLPLSAVYTMLVWMFKRNFYNFAVISPLRSHSPHSPCYCSRLMFSEIRVTRFHFFSPIMPLCSSSEPHGRIVYVLTLTCIFCLRSWGSVLRRAKTCTFGAWGLTRPAGTSANNRNFPSLHSPGPEWAYLWRFALIVSFLKGVYATEVFERCFSFSISINSADFILID